MAQKLIYVEGVGQLPFYKRRGTQSVKIRISGHDVKVSLPNWMPYSAAAVYVRQKAPWITEHRKEKKLIADGSIIGKQHTVTIKYAETSRISGRVTDTDIIVTAPTDTNITSPAVQKKLDTYARKALTVEAEDLIISQTRDLAHKYQLHVKSIEIKNLKSRWGSCSSNKDLAFSLFLIQLPWECIDYVIIHELAHTMHMNHSKDFWHLVESMEPQYKVIRKQLKSFSPHVIVQ